MDLIKQKLHDILIAYERDGISGGVEALRAFATCVLMDFQFVQEIMDEE